MRQWHQKLDGWSQPTPKSLDVGASHISGGIGLTPPQP